MEPLQVLPIQIKVDLEVMAIKEIKVYSTLPRSPKVKIQHQMQLSVLLRIHFLGGGGV